MKNNLSLLECLKQVKSVLEKDSKNKDLLREVNLQINSLLIDKKHPILFLGQEIYLSKGDRTNPNVLMIISMVEEQERLNGKGLSLLNKFYNQYGMKFNDDKLYNRITNALINGE